MGRGRLKKKSKRYEFKDVLLILLANEGQMSFFMFSLSQEKKRKNTLVKDLLTIHSRRKFLFTFSNKISSPIIS